MAVSLREYRAKIKSTQSMKKITRAMELIAASRIIKAQQHAAAAEPYARELTRAVSAVGTGSNTKHPLTTEAENPTRAAVLLLTSDRGLAGAFNSNAIKAAEQLTERLEREGKQVDTYIVGRRGVAALVARDGTVLARSRDAERQVGQRYPDLPVLEERIGARFLRDSHVLPLWADDGALILAMADPYNSFAIEAVRLIDQNRQRRLEAVCDVPGLGARPPHLLVRRGDMSVEVVNERLHLVGEPPAHNRRCP